MLSCLIIVFAPVLAFSSCQKRGLQRDDGLLFFSNGYTCVGVHIDGGAAITYLAGDFSGQGNYGHNVLRRPCVLEIETVEEMLSSGDSVSPELCEERRDAIKLCGVKAGNITETWTFSFSSAARGVRFSTEGVVDQYSEQLIVRHPWHLKPTSIYALFDHTGEGGGGVVQMRNQHRSKGYYPSTDRLTRVYALGGLVGERPEAGNFSVEFERNISKTVLLSSYNGSGLEDVLLGSFLAQYENTWTNSDAFVLEQNVAQGQRLYSDTLVTPNDADFPAGRIVKGKNLQTSDVQAFLTGIYASPVGCLCTHTNGVEQGVAVGQIATSVASPQRGAYDGLYNFFDPDNYFSVNAMLFSGDGYLQEEVRRVLEYSGSKLSSSGQLPHHFIGIEPVFSAISGMIQTGPNVFWILACFCYAKTTGKLTWLREYMPTLRHAASFLFDLVDPNVHLASVPGSLFIDVFIRSNYTADTNAMLVGFFNEFADAEEFVMWNVSGAELLRGFADNIAEAMNRLLWKDDHYVTQADADLVIRRDFVDYDANLIAVAHGIPSNSQADAIFARIAQGTCPNSQTWVSERFYGYEDTKDGNTGDSETAMGRIAWFDALARKRYQKSAAFTNQLLEPLKSRLLQNTWLTERLDCRGTEIRTSYYFEYPSVVAMMLRSVRYGIDVGFSSVEIRPLDVAEFDYNIGNVHVEFSPTKTLISMPLLGLYNFSLARQCPGATYEVVDLQAQPAPSRQLYQSSFHGWLRFSQVLQNGSRIQIRMDNGDTSCHLGDQARLLLYEVGEMSASIDIRVWLAIAPTSLAFSVGSVIYILRHRRVRQTSMSPKRV